MKMKIICYHRNPFKWSTLCTLWVDGKKPKEKPLLAVKNDAGLTNLYTGFTFNTLHSSHI